MEVLKSIEEFFNRFPEANEQGRRTALDEIESLPEIVKNNLPEFWKTALTKYPLSNLEIGVPSDFGQKELKILRREQLPLMSVGFLSALEISEQTTDYFPGHVLINKSILSSENYICIGSDNESTQEGIFISTKIDNPKPLLVFHDFGETKKLLIKNSEPVSISLGAMFNEAKIKNRNRIVSIDKMLETKDMLSSLLVELKNSALATPERIPETNSISEQRILDAILESSSREVTNEKIGAFMERLAGIDVLSIPNKQELWKQIHELYDICDLHKGNLYFSEAHSMI